MGNLGTEPASRKLPQARAQAIKPGSVLVADCSLSMSWVDSPEGVYVTGAPVGSMRRIDNLARVLAWLLSRTRLQALVCFNDAPYEVELAGRIRLPQPDGGTALHLALRHVAGLQPRPARVIVLSDGCPNVPEWALGEARALRPMPIDAYYVGPDGQSEPIAFMEQLAKAGGPGGRWGRYDMAEVAKVGEELRLRITGPR